MTHTSVKYCCERQPHSLFREQDSVPICHDSGKRRMMSFDGSRLLMPPSMPLDAHSPTHALALLCSCKRILMVQPVCPTYTPSQSSHSIR